MAMEYKAHKFTYMTLTTEQIKRNSRLLSELCYANNDKELYKIFYTYIYLYTKAIDIIFCYIFHYAAKEYVKTDAILRLITLKFN